MSLTGTVLAGREARPRAGAPAGERDLRWLASVLWPEADVRLAPARVPPGRRIAESYVVVPSAARPRVLLPFSTRALAGPALRRYDDGMSTLARVGRSLGSRAAASIIGWARFPPLVVFFDRDPHRDELLTQYLRQVFHWPDAVLAVSFGPPRSDRKPVAQVLTLEGGTLGFAKVAWNETTRALLATEVSTLRRFARERPRAFRVPELVHEGWWRGRPISVTAPVSTPGRRGRRPRVPGVDVIREIAGRGGIAPMPLATTPWWRSVLERAGARRHVTGEVVRWMQELHGRRLLWHGSWHGDWTPQNLATVDGVPHVWDWERARDGVPLGLDPIHFAFQVAMRRRPDVSRATRAAIGRSGVALRALGVPSDDDPLLLSCYLAELVARLEEDPGSRWQDRGGMGDAIVQELRRAVARA